MMQKIAANVVVSYFVMLGTQLVLFSLLEVRLALPDNLIIGGVFTVVTILLSLKGDEQWTLPKSDNSSTTETVSTAS